MPDTSTWWTNVTPKLADLVNANHDLSEVTHGLFAKNNTLESDLEELQFCYDEMQEECCNLSRQSDVLYDQYEQSRKDSENLSNRVRWFFGALWEIEGQDSPSWKNIEKLLDMCEINFQQSQEANEELEHHIPDYGRGWSGSAIRYPDPFLIPVIPVIRCCN